MTASINSQRSERRGERARSAGADRSRTASDPQRVGVLSLHNSKETKAILNAVRALGHDPVWVREENVSSWIDDDGVVYPDDHGARVTANELTGGGVRSVEGVGGDLEILEIEVTAEAPAAGRRLDQVGFPRGSLIVANAGGGRVSAAETVLDPGDKYLVAVEPAVLDELLNVLRG